MNGITADTALWYASRAAGVVALLMLSLVIILGVLTNRQGRLPGLPRFAVVGLHRNVALLTVAFITLHVLSAVFDGYVDIGLIAILVPFTSRYETFWLGLGAVAADLLLAVVVTRLGPRAWRATHWLTYAVYPIAVIHGLGAAHDLHSGGLLALTVTCALIVLVAVGWRWVRARAELPRWRRVDALTHRGSVR
jgi:methionine sulfoxide reductase heme-binding subunit